MDNAEHHSPFEFSLLVANPHIQALIDGLAMVLPDAQWWMLTPEMESDVYPFRKRENQPPSNFASLIIPKKGMHRCPTLVEVDGEGKILGAAMMRFREQTIGGIGINNIEEAQRPILEQTLRILESYFSLLSGVLEDHDDLETINNLWNETISVVDLNELLDRLIHEVCATLRADCGIILLIDEDGEFHPARVLGYPKDLQKNRELSLSKYDYLERIKNFRNSYYIMDESDPLLIWLCEQLEALSVKIDRGNHEAYAVPFLRGNNLIGIFVTLITNGQSFSVLKEHLLRILSSGGATALENAATVVATNQRRKALSTIHTVHRLISSNVPTKELLPRIGQLTRQLLKVKKCSIMMYDRKHERLVPAVQLGLEENEVGQHPIDLGIGLPGWVADNFNATVYHPRSAPPPWENAGETYPSESYMSAPLFDNDIEGVITVAEKSGDFTPGDREILMTFAEQVVLAIKNARMHEGERTITIQALKSIANLIETHDPREPGVTVKTCDLAGKISEELRVSERDQHHIIFAALLHDTGMIRYLWNKDTQDDLRLQGPMLSLNMVESLSLPGEVGEAVFHVNEAWNGQGYPGGLKGSQIPLSSRIIAVANTYCTLMAKYNVHMESEHDAQRRALRVVERLSKRAFDPDIVQTLKKLASQPAP